MADRNRPFRASYLISDVETERIFAELLRLDRFPEWTVGLRRAWTHEVRRVPRRYVRGRAWSSR